MIKNATQMHTTNLLWYIELSSFTFNLELLGVFKMQRWLFIDFNTLLFLRFNTSVTRLYKFLNSFCFESLSSKNNFQLMILYTFCVKPLCKKKKINLCLLSGSPRDGLSVWLHLWFPKLPTKFPLWILWNVWPFTECDIHVCEFSVGRYRQRGSCHRAGRREGW